MRRKKPSVRDVLVVLVICSAFALGLFLFFRYEPLYDQAVSYINRPTNELLAAMGKPEQRRTHSEVEKKGRRVYAGFAPLPSNTHDEYLFYRGRIGIIVVAVNGEITKEVLVLRP